MTIYIDITYEKEKDPKKSTFRYGPYKSFEKAKEKVNEFIDLMEENNKEAVKATVIEIQTNSPKDLEELMNVYKS